MNDTDWDWYTTTAATLSAENPIDTADVKETSREKIVKHMQAAIEEFSFDVYYPNEETNYRSY